METTEPCSKKSSELLNTETIKMIENANDEALERLLTAQPEIVGIGQPDLIFLE